MKDITLQIKKSEVWEEAAKNASYTGGRGEDKERYDDLMLTESDKEAWQRFWQEATAEANGHLKQLLKTAPALTQDYNVTLEVSSSFDQQLTSSVEANIFSFLSNTIVGKWYRFTYKAEAKDYEQVAESMMQEALRKLYSHKRPTRPARRRTPTVPTDDKQPGTTATEPDKE